MPFKKKSTSSSDSTTPKKKRGRPKKTEAELLGGYVEFSKEDDDSDYEPVAKSAGRRRRSTKKVSLKEASDNDEFEEDDEVGGREDDDDDYDAPNVKKRKQKTMKTPKSKKSTQSARRTLFIKNLPDSTTEDDVRALSADIQEVRIDQSQNKDEKHLKYAIIEFKDAETTERNYSALNGQKVKGSDIIVDYVGGRSIISYVKTQLMPSSDPLKLYVTGFGREIKTEQLKTMFPTCSDITLPLNPKDNNRPIGYAFIHYAEEGTAREAHDSMQDYVYQGRTLVVMYGKKSTPESERAAEEARQRNLDGPKSKKFKLERSDNEKNLNDSEEMQKDVEKHEDLVKEEDEEERTEDEGQENEGQENEGQENEEENEDADGQDPEDD